MKSEKRRFELFRSGVFLFLIHPKTSGHFFAEKKGEGVMTKLQQTAISDELRKQYFQQLMAIYS